MRTLFSAFLFTALFVATSAQAGVMESCRDKEKESDKVRACVRAERVHSINSLHDASLKAQEAVTQQTRESGRKLSLREYRSMQARHVRERNRTCPKQGGIEQVACEADMNYAQVDKLARFINQ
jgi:hypothetical protein